MHITGPKHRHGLLRLGFNGVGRLKHLLLFRSGRLFSREHLLSGLDHRLHLHTPEFVTSVVVQEQLAHRNGGHKLDIESPVINFDKIELELILVGAFLLDKSRRRGSRSLYGRELLLHRRQLFLFSDRGLHRGGRGCFYGRLYRRELLNGRGATRNCPAFLISVTRESSRLLVSSSGQTILEVVA